MAAAQQLSHRAKEKPPSSDGLTGAFSCLEEIAAIWPFELEPKTLAFTVYAPLATGKTQRTQERAEPKLVWPIDHGLGEAISHNECVQLLQRKVAWMLHVEFCDFRIDVCFLQLVDKHGFAPTMRMRHNALYEAFKPSVSDHSKDARQDARQNGLEKSGIVTLSHTSPLFLKPRYSVRVKGGFFGGTVRKVPRDARHA